MKMFYHSNYKKHTAIPRLDTPTIKLDRSELKRAEQTLVKRKLSPEELAEVIEKYGPPILPLNSKVPRKRKGGGAA
ncbi:hypothetical protein [Paenibacillus sp. 3LSP]|uniref:hypothetical protein n=1 Tax=Paenibacillus sp. 3LSP TaxID=2800795 RepID=UPI002905B900|nr:hypothetical protein [Paenibacillus sp. 3LSP]